MFYYIKESNISPMHGWFFVLSIPKYFLAFMKIGYSAVTVIEEREVFG